MKYTQIIRKIFLGCVPILLLVFGVLYQPLFFLDAMLCDALYQQTAGISPHIKIIAIDEETLEAYGDFEQWSREKTAQVISLLYQDKAHAPAMVGLDVLFVSDGEPQTDAELVQACKQANYVVMSSNLVYRGKKKVNAQGEVYYDDHHILLQERPYPALDAVIDHGFANAHIALDGYVRYTRLFETYQGETCENFAWKLYSAYERQQGNIPVIPPSDANGQMTFFYSGNIGEFPHFSLHRVLNGEVPVSEFEDCIVLIGAYAPGFQDAYATPVQRGGQMYGVEIHANIIQALMQGKTAIPCPVGLYLSVTCLLIAAYFLLANRQKLIPVLLEGAALIALHMLAGRLLALHGYTITQLYFILVVVFGMVGFLIEKYFVERIRKHKILAVFKTYVAPQIVDVLSKDDRLANRLGGEKRQVAVLFVDIRGFTALSEKLKPEEVVNILNEYLALTTRCIFQYQGTLDKFIGDATMAFFNAPVDLPDYIYRAVSAALAMREESSALSRHISENYGQGISFGIGVNCGEAVIGNIGCEVRMDYTAIGDTVNTAARLESRAQKNEILISEAVNSAVSDRIATEFVGEMELKGKQHAVPIYRVIGYKET